MDMEYWIASEGKPKGPYTINQLRSMELPGDTKVWHTGLTEWITMAELADNAREAAVSTEERDHETGSKAIAVTAEKIRDFLPWNLTFAIIWLVMGSIFGTAAGLVGVLYSYQTRKQLREGHIAEAAKKSHVAEAMVIVTITLGLISMPFSILMSMID